MSICVSKEHIVVVPLWCKCMYNKFIVSGYYIIFKVQSEGEVLGVELLFNSGIMQF